MPELPEVESFKNYLKATSLHQRIVHTHLMDERLLKATSRQRLSRRLKNTQLEQTYRHGKFVLVRTHHRDWLILHFGLTGQLHYYKDRAKKPKDTKIEFQFHNGCRLAYTSRRRLGRISLVRHWSEFIAQENLGMDALDPALTLPRWRRMLRAQRALVKSILLNQAFIAGIGNVYGDEILFQARLHPARQVSSLTHTEQEQLLLCAQSVLRMASARRANPNCMPPSWLLPRRHTDLRCPRCGAGLKHTRISGRTTWFCDHCQPRNPHSKK